MEFFLQCQSKMLINVVFSYAIFSRMNIIVFSDAGNVTFNYIFSVEDYLCFFWQKFNIIFVNLYIERKYHISMYVLRKVIFHFPSKEKMSYLREKRNNIFPDITKKIIFPLFWNGIFHTPYFFFRLKNKIIFSGKINIIFPDNPRKIILQCDFLERSSFRQT